MPLGQGTLLENIAEKMVSSAAEIFAIGSHAVGKPDDPISWRVTRRNRVQEDLSDTSNRFNKFFKPLFTHQEG